MTTHANAYVPQDRLVALVRACRTPEALSIFHHRILYVSEIARRAGVNPERDPATNYYVAIAPMMFGGYAQTVVRHCLRLGS